MVVVIETYGDRGEFRLRLRLQLRLRLSLRWRLRWRGRDRLKVWVGGEWVCDWVCEWARVHTHTPAGGVSAPPPLGGAAAVSAPPPLGGAAAVSAPPQVPGSVPSEWPRLAWLSLPLQPCEWPRPRPGVYVCVCVCVCVSLADRHVDHRSDSTLIQTRVCECVCVRHERKPMHSRQPRFGISFASLCTAQAG